MEQYALPSLIPGALSVFSITNKLCNIGLDLHIINDDFLMTILEEYIQKLYNDNSKSVCSVSDWTSHTRFVCETPCQWWGHSGSQGQGNKVINVDII